MTEQAPVYQTRWPRVVLRCTNAQCRIETYVGAPVLPLSSCPVCLFAGSVTAVGGQS